jgi:hypothetical protein
MDGSIATLFTHLYMSIRSTPVRNGQFPFIDEFSVCSIEEPFKKAIWIGDSP